MKSPRRILWHLSGSARWAALGLLALIFINIAFDLARADGSLCGPGAFLHVEFHQGAPSGPLIDILQNASRVIILALGMTLVIAVRGVDLSVGSVMAIAGAIAATIVSSGHSPTLAIIAALACSAACGLWNGLLVRLLGVQPIIATLILMVAGRGIAQMITQGQITTFQSPALAFIGTGRIPWIPLPFATILAIALLLITLFAVRASALGLLIESVGGNPVASRLAGIQDRTLVIGAYAFCGLCAGLAGLIDAANIRAADPFHSGVNAELAAIFAVIVGGTSFRGGGFSLTGAFVGGLLMQALTTTMYARNISADVAPLPQALVILAVCLLASPSFRRKIWKRKATA